MEQVKILEAQDEYETKLHFCGSLTDWVRGLSEGKSWSVLGEAVGDLPVEYGSMNRALSELADEYENWDAPSSLFKEKAAVFMWMVMSQIQEIKESEE